MAEKGVDLTPIFKMIIVGGEGTGKTSIFKAYQRMLFNENQKSSDQANEIMMRVDLQGFEQQIDLWIFDLPGKENLMGLNKMYLRDANIALIVYDVMNKDSVDSIKLWQEELQNAAPSEVIVALCGNKLD